MMTSLVSFHYDVIIVKLHQEPPCLQDCTWTWRSNAFRKCLKALKKLLLIVNISIYICTTGRFWRTFHLQVTINFIYEILIHFKGSCKDSEKLFITNLALNLAWQLNDTITYSVTASQTWQDIFICISLSCWFIHWYGLG